MAIKIFSYFSLLQRNSCRCRGYNFRALFNLRNGVCHLSLSCYLSSLFLVFRSHCFFYSDLFLIIIAIILFVVSAVAVPLSSISCPLCTAFLATRNASQYIIIQFYLPNLPIPRRGSVGSMWLEKLFTLDFSKLNNESFLPEPSFHVTTMCFAALMSYDYFTMTFFFCQKV